MNEPLAPETVSDMRPVERPKVDKLQTLMVLLLCVSAFHIVLYAYWYFWPYDVFKFTAPIKILTPHVTAGLFMEYEMDYCKSTRHEDLLAEVQFVFIDHLLNITPRFRERLSGGCGEQKAYIRLPRLPPGLYRIQMNRDYQVNPVRAIRVSSVSDEFEVFVK